MFFNVVPNIIVSEVDVPVIPVIYDYEHEYNKYRVKNNTNQFGRCKNVKCNKKSYLAKCQNCPKVVFCKNCIRKIDTCPECGNNVWIELTETVLEPVEFVEHVVVEPVIPVAPVVVDPVIPVFPSVGVSGPILPFETDLPVEISGPTFYGNIII